MWLLVCFVLPLQIRFFPAAFTDCHDRVLLSEQISPPPKSLLLRCGFLQTMSGMGATNVLSEVGD